MHTYIDTVTLKWENKIMVHIIQLIIIMKPALGGIIAVVIVLAVGQMTSVLKPEISGFHGHLKPYCKHCTEQS